MYILKFRSILILHFSSCTQLINQSLNQNPLIISREVDACEYISPISEASRSTVITRPGCFATCMYEVQALDKWLKNSYIKRLQTCSICVVWDSKHNKWTSFTRANSIASIDRWDACPSSIRRTGLVGGGGGYSSQKIEATSSKFRCIHPSCFTVFGKQPILSLSGMAHFRGKIIMGGNMNPEAPTHAEIICIFPLSAAVTYYTFFWFSSAITSRLVNYSNTCFIHITSTLYLYRLWK